MKSEVKKYFQFISDRKIYHSPKSLYWYYQNQLFKGIDFENKFVLDIGGGSGLTSFYAAAMGSERVDLIEPLGDGSGTVEMSKFLLMKNSIGFNSEKVLLHNTTFQEFTPANKYNIIVLHNSINHLNESACKNMLKDEISYAVYTSIFENFYSLLSSNGMIVIADCSRNNFFGSLGLKSPFAWTIEWEKHHNPETWVELLQLVGFRNSRIKWTTQKQLRSFGNLILSNRVAAYFLSSHFIIQSTK